MGEMMIQTTVQWISGKNFIGVDSTRHSVVLSADDQGIGVKPSEMLLVPLSSCTAVEQAIRLSQEKYCSVAATVRGVAQITTSFEILPVEG